MKMKKIVTTLCMAAMSLTLLAGCGGSSSSTAATEAPAAESVEETTAAVADDAAAGETHKIGITIQSLSNAYWAGVMSKLEEVLKDAGWEYTLVECQDNPATQVSQIENFITSGCDFIMVHPSDANAVENVCGEALEAGIKVMCWDDPMENTTANWVLDNTVLGEEIGKSAAEFINEHYTADNPAQVVVIGYPSTKVLLERANGIKAGLEEYCNEGNYEIVAEVDGIEANEAQTNCETALQANPDAKVFVGVGAGAMIGANEALLQTYGEGNIPEDCGVITTDVTSQQLDSLKSGTEAVRAIIGFEGSNLDTAEACFEMYKRICGGEEFTAETKNVYREISPITTDNIDEILAGM